MTWLRPVRFGNEKERAKVEGAGTADPYDTHTSALQFYRNQRPYQSGQLWVGKGLITPEPSAIDMTAPLAMAGALVVFFLMQ